MRTTWRTTKLHPATPPTSGGGEQRSSEEQRGEPRSREEHTVNISCGQQKQKTNRLIFYCRRRRASGWRRPNAGVLASERPSPKRHRHALRLWPIRWWREEDRRRSWRLKKPSNAGKVRTSEKRRSRPIRSRTWTPQDLHTVSVRGVPVQRAAEPARLELPTRSSSIWSTRTEDTLLES